MKYIDSNIFIHSLLSNDEKARLFRKILFDIANKKIIAGTSLLTWDEVTYIIMKHKGKKAALHHSEKFINFPNMIFIGMELPVHAKADQLFRTYNLDPRDAIHIATAILSGASEVISDDSDFDKINEIKRIDPKEY